MVADILKVKGEKVLISTALKLYLEKDIVLELGGVAPAKDWLQVQVRDLLDPEHKLTVETEWPFLRFKGLVFVANRAGYNTSLAMLDNSGLEDLRKEAKVECRPPLGYTLDSLLKTVDIAGYIQFSLKAEDDAEALQRLQNNIADYIKHKLILTGNENQFIPLEALYEKYIKQYGEVSKKSFYYSFRFVLDKIDKSGLTDCNIVNGKPCYRGLYFLKV